MTFTIGPVEAQIPPHLAATIIKKLHGDTRCPVPADDGGLDNTALLFTARSQVLAWRSAQEQAWKAKKEQEFQGKVAEELDRLTQALMGPEGLDPDAWNKLPRKLELLAQRNVQRQDMLEKKRLELNEWDTRPRIAARVRQLAAEQRRRTMPDEHVAAPREALSRPRTTGGAEPLSRKPTTRRSMTLDSMHVQLAASICNRMAALGLPGATLPLEDRWLNEEGDDMAAHERGEGEDGADYGSGRQMQLGPDFVRHLAEDMRTHSSRYKKPRHLSAQVSRVAAVGTQAAASMALRLHQEEMRQAEEQAAAAAAGPGGLGDGETGTVCDRDTDDDTRGSLVRGVSGGHGRVSQAGSTAAYSVTGSLTKGGGPLLSKAGSMAGSTLSRAGTTVSRMFGAGSAAGSRRQAAMARAAKKAVTSPLVRAYTEACTARGVYISPEMCTQLALSESTRELKLTGVALPDAVAQTIAEVIAKTDHLTSVSFSRTILNPGALASLLPACWPLRLREVQLVTTDMTPECWPHLLAALHRPTHSLVTPPSEWWMTLRSLSLSGNPLGDQGLAVLAPALKGLQALTQLDLSQAGVTDWSAPVLEDFLRSATQLTSLTLAHNQLGPQSGRALAGVLPTHPSLTHLDLSWNPMGGGGVALLAWGLIAPRAARQSKIASLLLCGVDLESDDHLALAALLKWGASWLQLEKLDISHNSLLGVSAQILMRQLDALLPSKDTTSTTNTNNTNSSNPPTDLYQPSEIDKDSTQSDNRSLTKGPVPKLNLAKTISQALSVKHEGRVGRLSIASQSQSAVGTLSTRSLAPPSECAMSDGSRSLDRSFDVTMDSARRVQQQWRAPKLASQQHSLKRVQDGSMHASGSVLGGAGASGLQQQQGAQRAGAHGRGRGGQDMSGSRELQVIAMGCQVDVDGGQAPTPRVRLDGSEAATFPGGPNNTRSGKAARSRVGSAASETAPAARVWRQVGGRPVQHFELRLDVPRPDHYVAQLLVEHELDARRHHCMSWQNVKLNDTVYRVEGQDVQPLDVLWSGWAHPGVLPSDGLLVLDVAPLPERASSWLRNPRLHFNAARLLKQ